MFYTAGIVISFFLGVLLFTKKKNSLGDRILACWLFVIGIHLYFFYTYLTQTIYETPWLLGLSFPFPLLHGPFLYLYARAVTGSIYTFKPKHALHFLPAFLSYLYLIPFLSLSSAEKIEIFRHKGAGYEGYMMANTAAILLSGIVYVVLTTLLHRKHKRKILDEFSYTEKINLDWIQYLIYSIALIWVFVILSKDNLVFGSAVLFVMFIGYFGFRQVGIFTSDGHPAPHVPVEIQNEILPEEKIPPIQKNETISTVETPENSPPLKDESPEQVQVRKKYSKSGLSAEAAAELHEKLRRLMDSEKLFSESELNLTDLSKKLHVHPNYLSQVINEKEGKNFYDYINTLRIEEFKRIVAHPANKKFTLLSLAYECGFNSKSSFNKYFKKVTGLSPTEYLQQQNVEMAA